MTSRPTMPRDRGAGGWPRMTTLAWGAAENDACSAPRPVQSVAALTRRNAVGGEDPAPVKHDHLVVRRELVDQMRRPQHRDAALAAERMHVLDQPSAGSVTSSPTVASSSSSTAGRCSSARATSTRRRVGAASLAAPLRRVARQPQPLELDGDPLALRGAGEPVQLPAM